jgi:hypothetical protein
MAGRLLIGTACGCLLGLAPSAVIRQSLVSLIMPNLYHIFDTNQFKGPGYLTFLYLYCSIAGLCLAMWALVKCHSRAVALLAVMSVFDIFWMLGENAPLWNMTYPHLPEIPESPVLDLLNVRYLLATAQGAERLYPLGRFRLAAHLPGYELLENVTAMPRFFLVHEARQLSLLAEARAIIDSRQIDFGRTAITDEAIRFRRRPLLARPKRLGFWITRPIRCDLRCGVVAAPCWCYRKPTIRDGTSGWTAFALRGTRYQHGGPA